MRLLIECMACFLEQAWSLEPFVFAFTLLGFGLGLLIEWVACLLGLSLDLAWKLIGVCLSSALACWDLKLIIDCIKWLAS